MIYIPEKIKSHLNTEIAETDTIGCSNALVRRFGDMYLKQMNTSPSFTREQKVIKWLNGKLPVPRIIEQCSENGIDYLLMTRVPGEMACSKANLDDPETTVRLLAEGLLAIWQVDIAACPFESTPDIMLKDIEADVHSGKMCEADWDSTEFGSAEELLQYLCETKPADDLVFSHGDYCLPNVFINDGKISGFIDLGDAGVSDRWNDISMCLYSMKRNFNTEKYNYMLFEYLDISPDPERLRWWSLFDELCWKR